jgi:hypothetical protein
LGSTLQKTRQR